MLVTLISCILILFSILPFVQHQHWIFRVPEFLKLQILILQTIAFALLFFFSDKDTVFWTVQLLQLLLIGYHLYILSRYTKFWRTPYIQKSKSASEPIKIIACNVYQDNRQHHRFVELIQRERPDIVLTMESDTHWEQALRELESIYPYVQKVTLDNTYGMHFYTRLKIINIQTHYFVADDIPSIEAELESKDGHRFVFFGVHPPPPSPTEEETSKERDGDLLSVAKRVRGYNLPVLVAGDFNNVAWAKSSILFRKTSELIDARIGRGVLSTFHAKYWFFRVPLDLLFHSPQLFIDQLNILSSIGSDHFPVSCTFHIDRQSDEQEERIEELENDEMQEVNELIQEGKEENSDNRSSE
ncbi:endonuclease/exonuclease/phosphatase family protein [Sphingobacterium faecale]|uniref:Endonuclease/exonuclease/phosphatase family protein n=1 Tax=Sphingobacterium faecale TaxID=2803775 RepID=A0ABS1QZ08_9SPHI|nr:endonuclease/exonuclease/phosphatase family protein [Sphingobacterium faecale]MBL1407661.1 endonuclease/exonuclease/phosphatase family protein [Sphingobacterium faecale]